MAYDASASARFSGRSNYDLFIYVRRDQTDIRNNRATYAWELQARHVAGSNLSWAADSFSWGVNVAGQQFNGSGNLDFRGRGVIVFGRGATNWVGHDANGYLGFNFYGSMGPAGIFGRADAAGNIWTDRIPRPASAPNIYQASPTADGTQCEVRFTSQGMDYGGVDLTGWTMQLATNSSFTVNVRTFAAANNGIQVITNLTPGTRYYVRVAARNSVTDSYGALGGAWSNTGVFDTPLIQSLGRTWNGTRWVPVDGRIPTAAGGGFTSRLDGRIRTSAGWVAIGE